MSSTKKLACLLTIGACAGWTLMDAAGTWSRDNGSTPHAVQGSSGEGYMPPTQSFWSVLDADAGAR